MAKFMRSSVLLPLPLLNIRTILRITVCLHQLEYNGVSDSIYRKLNEYFHVYHRLHITTSYCERTPYFDNNICSELAAFSNRTYFGA